jgi:hypothetical protein
VFTDCQKTLSSVDTNFQNVGGISHLTANAKPATVVIPGGAAAFQSIDERFGNTPNRHGRPQDHRKILATI